MKRKHEGRGEPSSSSQHQAIHLGDDDDRVCFVSHSGAHKRFAELLCRDLEAAGCSAFFDKQSDYWAKGEASGAATLGVAAACRLGILLLSEEFFMASKWPMMELAKLKECRNRIMTSVAAPAKILPVYLKLNISQFKDYQTRQALWFEKWETWARQDRSIDLKAWKGAVRDIEKHPGIHICLAQRMKDDAEGRKEIVARVTDIRYGFIPRAARPVLPVATDAPVPQSKGECSHVVKTATSNTDEESDEHNGSDKNIENEDLSYGGETTPSDKAHDSEEESVEHEEREDGDMSENEEAEGGAEEDEDYDGSEDGDGDDNNTNSGSDGDNSG